MDGELLTVAEVAERLKLHHQTIRNWIDRGELPAVRLGPRRVRVKESDLDKFIAASTSTGENDSQAARQRFAQAQEAVEAASTDAELAVALRRLARASTALARALS